MRPKDMTKVEFWQDWRPWMAFVIVGLFFVGGWVGTLNNSALKRASFHRAEVARCIAQRPLASNLSKHIGGVNKLAGGVNELARILVQNNAALVVKTPEGDPQYKVRLANLHRIVRARNEVIRARDEVAALKKLPVPTVAQCHNDH